MTRLAAVSVVHATALILVFCKMGKQTLQLKFCGHRGEVTFAGHDVAVSFPDGIMRAVYCNLFMGFFCTDKPLSPKALKGLENTQLTKNYYPVVSFKVLIIHFNKYHVINLLNCLLPLKIIEAICNNWGCDSVFKCSCFHSLDSRPLRQ